MAGIPVGAGAGTGTFAAWNPALGNAPTDHKQDALSKAQRITARWYQGGTFCPFDGNRWDDYLTMGDANEDFAVNVKKMSVLIRADLGQQMYNDVPGIIQGKCASMDLDRIETNGVWYLTDPNDWAGFPPNERTTFEESLWGVVARRFQAKTKLFLTDRIADARDRERRLRAELGASHMQAALNLEHAGLNTDAYAFHAENLKRGANALLTEPALRRPCYNWKCKFHTCVGMCVHSW